MTMPNLIPAALALANAERAEAGFAPLENLNSLTHEEYQRYYKRALTVFSNLVYPSIQGTVLMWEPIELADKDGYISVPVLAEMGQYAILRARWAFGLQAWVNADGRRMTPQPTLFCKVLRANTLPSMQAAETSDKTPDQ